MRAELLFPSRVTSDLSDEFSIAIAGLGFPQPHPRVRIALRRWDRARNYKIPIRFIHAAIIVATVTLYAQAWFWYAKLILSFMNPFRKPIQQHQNESVQAVTGYPILLAAGIATLVLIYTYVFYVSFNIFVALPYALAVRIMTLGTTSRRGKAAVARQTVLVSRAAKVVISANRVRSQGIRLHSRNMNQLIRHLQELKRQLARQHQSSYVPLFSARARRLRNHQRIVIAALDRVEAELDRTPIESLNTLVELVIRIVERYTHGLSGALLPDEDLEAVQPVRDWEPFRLALAAVAMSGTAISVAFFDLPDPAITALVGATGLISISLLYGRGARSALDVIDAVRGQ